MEQERAKSNLAIFMNRVSLKHQIARLWPVLAVGFTLGILVLVDVYTFSRATGVPISRLTRDVADAYDTGFYAGFLSNLGNLLWSAATAICFFALTLLARDNRHRRASRFLFCSGLLCLLLTLDDTFLFHEEVLPGYFHVPEFVVYIGYVVMVAGYLAYFIRRILMTDYIFLLIALVFLGLSAAADQFLPFSNRETFFEDGLKFMGIVFWLAYFALVAAMVLRDAFTASK